MEAHQHTLLFLKVQNIAASDSFWLRPDKMILVHFGELVTGQVMFGYSATRYEFIL
jgi:hypothetical protein